MSTLFLFGCGANETGTTNSSEKNNTASTNQEETNTETSDTQPEPNPTDENSIVVIKMSRDVFLDFISNPSSQAIEDMGKDVRKNVSAGDIYIRGSVLFPIEQSVANLLKKENLKTYLEQQEIYTDVKEAFLLDAENVPMLIWIDADNFQGFITINELSGEGHGETPYIYRLYTKEAFFDKFSGIAAAVMIKNSQTYGKFGSAVLYHNYADVPLLETLRLLGATIVEKNENLAEILYKGNTYELDAEYLLLCPKGSSRDMLRPLPGGRVFHYKNEGVVMVDSGTMSGVLWTMETPVWFEFDRSEKLVRIELK